MKKFIAILLAAVLSGCSMAEIRQEWIGLSISDVKNARTRQTQQYDISSDECLAKIRETLADLKAIAREDVKNKFIVADNFKGKFFKSCIDTTQVGILVTPWEKNKSQVDVASGNADLAIFVSKKISEKIKPVKEAAPKEDQVKEEIPVTKQEHQATN